MTSGGLSTPPAQRAAVGTAVAVLAVLLAWPAVASGAVPVGIYPLLTDSLSRDEVADLEAVLESGLNQASRHDGLTPRQPVLLPATCGRVPLDDCLAGLAAEGAVLVARGRREGIHVMVSIALVDGKGRRTRAASFLTTLSIQDARPCAQALTILEFELERLGASAPAAPVAAAPAGPRPPGPAAAPPAPAPAAPRPSAPPAVAAPAAPPAAASPPAARPTARPPTPAPAVATSPPTPEPERPATSASWQRRAAAWITGGGLALVGGGALAGLRGRALERRLDARFRAGTLAPGDAPSYREARRYGLAANVLFAAGGLVAASGATLFLLAPAVEPVQGGVTVGLAGSF